MWPKRSPLEDDESTWLTETELLDAPVPRRHLSAVRAESGAIPLHPHRPANPASADSASGPEAPSHAADDDGTDALLEDLANRRGTREPLEIEQDEDDDAF